VAGRSAPDRQVLLGRAEGLRLLRLQEALLFIMVVCDFAALLSWDARDDWALSGVLRVLGHADALLQEVEFHLLDVLAVVQTDLDATSATANALHIVLFNGGFENVFAGGDLFQVLCVRAWGQVTHNKVYDIGLGLHTRLVVPETRSSEFEVVAGEHGLFGRFRLSTGHFRLQYWRGDGG